MEIKRNPDIHCTYPNNLQYDEGCLNIITHGLTRSVKLFYQYEECHKCDYLEWTNILPNSNTSLLVKTTDRLLFYLKGHEHDSCSQNYFFGQHGIYGWNVTKNGCSSVYTLKPPDSPYYPLYVTSGLLILFLIASIILQLILKTQWFRRRNLSSMTATEDGQETPTTESAPLVPSELVPAVRLLQQTRVNSLDTFRGIAIILMIFVNYGGGKYWFFRHSPWNGLTVADVIFPWFAWIMGVSIALSVRSKLRSGLKRPIIMGQAFLRTIYLLLFGVFCSNLHNNNMATLRLPGVLQRLGLSYFIVTVLESLLMKRQPDFQYGRWVILQDILDSWAQWITVLIVVGLHSFITFYLEVPGCPTGYLGPGGLDDHQKYFNCTGGAAGFIDRQIFGIKHIYQKPTSAHLYHSEIPFDPEGLLGLMTTILTVYLGVAAGRVILCSNSTNGRVKRWVIYAVITGVIAGFLCDWSKEGGLIPINKNLWSLSFALLTSSFAFVMIIILYLLVDHYKWWSGNSLSYAGMNSILLYIGHGLVKDSYPFSYTPVDLSSHTGYLSQNIFGMFLWLAIAHRLYKKGIFLSV